MPTTTQIIATLTPSSIDPEVSPGATFTTAYGGTIVTPTGDSTTATAIGDLEGFSWLASIAVPVGGVVVSVAAEVQADGVDVQPDDGTSLAHFDPTAPHSVMFWDNITAGSAIVPGQGAARGGGGAYTTPPADGPLAADVAWSTDSVGIFIVQDATDGSTSVGPSTGLVVTFTVEFPDEPYPNCIQPNACLPF